MMNNDKGYLTIWGIVVTVLVVLAVFASIVYVKNQKDLNSALESEYEAIKQYDAFLSSADDQRMLSRALRGERNDASPLVNILNDEKDHAHLLKKYLLRPAEEKTLTLTNITVDMLIESEKEAIAEYKELSDKIFIRPVLKEDLNEILADENAHLKTLIAYKETELNEGRFNIPSLSDIIRMPERAPNMVSGGES